MNEVYVRYIGKKFCSFFGGLDYKATPRHVRVKDGSPVDWRIIDKDGDQYTVAKGTLSEGLERDWIVLGGNGNV